MASNPGYLLRSFLLYENAPPEYISPSCVWLCSERIMMYLSLESCANKTLTDANNSFTRAIKSLPTQQIGPILSMHPAVIFCYHDFQDSNLFSLTSFKWQKLFKIFIEFISNFPPSCFLTNICYRLMIRILNYIFLFEWFISLFSHWHCVSLFHPSGIIQNGMEISSKSHV